MQNSTAGSRAPRVRLHQERLLRNPLHRQMLESRRRAAEEEERARRRSHVLTILSFLFWTVLGCVIAGWGMHTQRTEYSRVALEAGLIVGNAGILATLLRAYRGRE